MKNLKKKRSKLIKIKLSIPIVRATTIQVKVGEVKALN
jgi:hypothetical protein